MDLSTAETLLAIGAVLIPASVIFIRFMMKLNNHLDEKTSTEDIERYIKDLSAKLEALADDMSDVRTIIRTELRPNSGKSIRDRIIKIEEQIRVLYRQLPRKDRENEN